jgi:UDP-N-acetylmuramoyl-L-alanyl-D-glutamate--2,6-diaminopimelate ligase
MQTSKETENIERPSHTQPEFLAPRFAIVPDRAEAIRFGVNMARAGDVVASFGKGHERSMCYGETEYPWNEQDAMLSALRARTQELAEK